MRRAAYLPVRSFEINDQKQNNETPIIPVVITTLELIAEARFPSRICWVARVPPQPGQSIPVASLIGQLN